MTPTHYLRVEGVNLGAFVFDTRDLSTMRGASLMLLDAVGIAKSALDHNVGGDKVDILSQGASSGLFALEAADPQAVADAVRTRLAREFPHATFVVDVKEISGDFHDDVESLLAANHWRQMQATSLSIPPASTNAASSKSVCALDGVRAVGGGEMVRGHQVSASVWHRREYGRSEKQTFYAKKTGSRDLPDFAQDFDAIATGTRLLNGKLAVFYADGNRFGGIQAEHCTSPPKQQAWDDFVRGKREAFLQCFLDEQIKADAEAWQNAGTARFETMLWGGDEVMFVMPAALGWRFAKLFFEKLGGLNLKNAGAGLPNVPLSHAAALVFCQHHAPIDRIKRLLKDQMAEFAKATDRDRDSLAVVALESFDHLGSGYEEAMKQRYKGILELKDTLLCGRNGTALSAICSRVSDGIASLHKSESFARSQLRGLVRDMIARPAEASARARFSQDKSGEWLPPHEFRKAGKEDCGILYTNLRPCFASDVALWVELEELWDYAVQ